MRWEDRKRTNDEQVLTMINRMKRPVGVVLFGVDCEFKHEVRQMCWGRLREVAEASSREHAMNLERAYRAIQARRNVLVVMPGSQSVWDFKRREIVMALRRLGALSVVGIFAKKLLVTKLPDMNEPEVIEMNNFIKGLEMQPPQVDEFDRLIIVEDAW